MWTRMCNRSVSERKGEGVILLLGGIRRILTGKRIEMFTMSTGVPPYDVSDWQVRISLLRKRKERCGRGLIMECWGIGFLFILYLYRGALSGKMLNHL